MDIKLASYILFSPFLKQKNIYVYTIVYSTYDFCRCHQQYFCILLILLLLLQLNEITPYMDGGLVYGIAKGWADVLRLDHNGHLAPNGQLAEHHEVSERCNVNPGDSLEGKLGG